MSDPPHPAASDAANTSHARTPSHTSVLSAASSRSSGPSNTQGNLHAPQTPSRLRHSHAPGSSPTPESELHQYHTFASSPPQADSPTQVSSLRSSSPPIDFEADGIYPRTPNGPNTAESLEQTRAHGHIIEDHSLGPDSSTALLENYNRKRADCGQSLCSHGTFSPSAGSFAGQDSGSYGGRYRDEEEHNGERGDTAHRVLGDAITDGLLGGRMSRPKTGRLESFMSWRGSGNHGNGISTTRWLAEAHGIKGKRRMYLTYYIPFFNCESITPVDTRRRGRLIQHRDKPVSPRLLKRRLDRSHYYGILLYPHVAFLRLKSRSPSSYKWPLFFRLQSPDICLPRHVSSNGCWS